MDVLSNTGVPIKYSGDHLSHKDFNKINTTLNSGIDSINYLLKSYYNVNLENNQPNKLYSLEEVIKLIPLTRRDLCLRVSFLSSINNNIGYVEYIYIGDSLTDESWNNSDNWGSFDSVIDGGEWD